MGVMKVHGYLDEIFNNRVQLHLLFRAFTVGRWRTEFSLPQAAGLLVGLYIRAPLASSRVLYERREV